MAPFRSRFIEPCLPSPAANPPAGSNWIHEIKHDGFRMMARRDAAGVRLLTRNGHDWTARFPLMAAAVDLLRVKSCLIDGEAVACDGDGMPVFDRLRYRRQDRRVFLYAFDLLELNGRDMRREALEVRKHVLAMLLRKNGVGIQRAGGEAGSRGGLGQAEVAVSCGASERAKHGRDREHGAKHLP